MCKEGECTCHNWSAPLRVHLSQRLLIKAWEGVSHRITFGTSTFTPLVVTPRDDTGLPVAEPGGNCYSTVTMHIEMYGISLIQRTVIRLRLVFRRTILSSWWLRRPTAG